MQSIKDSAHFEIDQWWLTSVVRSFTGYKLKWPDICSKCSKALKQKQKFPTVKCGCTSLHHFKYALKKKRHKNEEVGSLTTGYLLLVTKPVCNSNRQDLLCVQNRILRGFARYVFLVNFFENRSLH